MLASAALAMCQRRLSVVPYYPPTTIHYPPRHRDHLSSPSSSSVLSPTHPRSDPPRRTSPPASREQAGARPSARRPTSRRHDDDTATASDCEYPPCIALFFTRHERILGPAKRTAPEAYTALHSHLAAHPSTTSFTLSQTPSAPQQQQHNLRTACCAVRVSGASHNNPPTNPVPGGHSAFRRLPAGVGGRKQHLGNISPTQPQLGVSTCSAPQ